MAPELHDTDSAHNQTRQEATQHALPSDERLTPPLDPIAEPALASSTSPEPESSNDDGKYTVNVKRYAQYDKSIQGYEQGVQKNIRYAARTPFARFAIDFAAVLTCPSVFWKGQDAHPVTIAQLHFPHLTVLVLLRIAACFVGGILSPNANVYNVIIQAGAQGILIFASVWLLALLIAAITALGGGGFRIDRALRFVGYSITPLLFVGIIAIIPVPYLNTVCDLLAMPWAFVVMGCGVLPCLHIKDIHAPMMTGLFCGLLLCLWGAMPMFLPYLLGWFL